MKTLKSFLSVVAILSATAVFSQPPPPPAAPGVPIDGGLGLLLAGGVIYGVKRLWDTKKIY